MISEEGRGRGGQISQVELSIIMFMMICSAWSCEPEYLSYVQNKNKLYNSYTNKKQTVDLKRFHLIRSVLW